MDNQQVKTMVQIAKDSQGSPFGNSLFKCISIGRANDLLRTDYYDQIKELQSIMHFQYCRFHGIFHDAMAVVRRKENGQIVYQWHQVDKVTDNLLSLGLKPFWELSSMPETMASKETYAFKWKFNSSEPKDYQEWGDLVKAFVSHMVDRYSLDEVRTWYFEVWNEPDLKNFWVSGMKAYHTLYTYAVKAVKSVDPALRVGGPASAGIRAAEDFLDYCIENGLPLDFVSCHAYPQGEYCEYKNRQESIYEPGRFTKTRVDQLYEHVKRSSRPNLEIHWTEWNTQSASDADHVSWLFNPTVDSLFSAGCIVNNMLSVKDHLHSISYWIVSDLMEERGLPNSPFSFSYGLMNLQGIKKASFHAFSLLKKMNGREMKITMTDEMPIGCGLSAVEENGISKVLLYNSHLPDIEQQPDWAVQFSLQMANDTYIATSARICQEHGSCYETWIQMGKPQNLSRTQEEMLRYLSTPEYNFSEYCIDNGQADVSVVLKPNEVLYIEFQKKEEVAAPTSEKEEDIASWNKALMVNETF